MNALYYALIGAAAVGLTGLWAGFLLMWAWAVSVPF